MNRAYYVGVTNSGGVSERVQSYGECVYVWIRQKVTRAEDLLRVLVFSGRSK